MLQLTTTQIAARLGVSERTAYRWIERGVLRATRARRGNKYSVDEKDLDALARNEPDELAAMGQRITDLEHQVAELRQLVENMQQAPARTTRPAPVIPLAPGEVAARTFAERHNLTRDSMQGWIKRGEIETTPRAIGRDLSRTQHMLTPAQQAQVIQFWQANSVEYTPCSDCPHEG